MYVYRIIWYIYNYKYIHKGLPVTLLDSLEQCHWTLRSEMELQATTTMHDIILHCNHLAGNPTVSTASRALKAEGEHGGNVWRIRIPLENCAQMYFELYILFLLMWRTPGRLWPFILLQVPITIRQRVVGLWKSLNLLIKLIPAVLKPRQIWHPSGTGRWKCNFRAILHCQIPVASGM